MPKNKIKNDLRKVLQSKNLHNNGGYVNAKRHQKQTAISRQKGKKMKKKFMRNNFKQNKSFSSSQQENPGPSWMSSGEFADKNHPQWDEYRQTTSIPEMVKLIHRDWGAGNTIDLTRNLTKHSNRQLPSMIISGCQYCANRCHCSPGRKIIRPYPIAYQNRPWLDPDVDLRTEKILKKSEDVASDIRDCVNTAMHNEVLDLQEHSEEFRSYAQMASDLMGSTNEIFDTAKHFPYTELGPDFSQEELRELISVELTQDRYRKIYNSPYEGLDDSDDEEEEDED